MSIYELTNYLFVCENQFLGIGCGTELVVEQKRSFEAAATAATAEGWQVYPPSAFDEDRRWASMCSRCSNAWEAKRAEWEAQRAPVEAGNHD